jgi:hypothetical protein
MSDEMKELWRRLVDARNQQLSMSEDANYNAAYVDGIQRAIDEIDDLVGDGDDD